MSKAGAKIRKQKSLMVRHTSRQPKNH